MKNAFFAKANKFIFYFHKKINLSKKHNNLIYRRFYIFVSYQKSFFIDFFLYKRVKLCSSIKMIPDLLSSLLTWNLKEFKIFHFVKLRILNANTGKPRFLYPPLTLKFFLSFKVKGGYY